MSLFSLSSVAAASAGTAIPAAVPASPRIKMAS